jgi:hypothetical protein
MIHRSVQDSELSVLVYVEIFGISPGLPELFGIS